jgi:hypothetical protein
MNKNCTEKGHNISRDTDCLSSSQNCQLRTYSGKGPVKSLVGPAIIIIRSNYRTELMRTKLSTLQITLFVLLLGSFVPAAAELESKRAACQAEQVKFVGSMTNVKMPGDPEARIDLKTLEELPHLYALGPGAKQFLPVSQLIEGI